MNQDQIKQQIADYLASHPFLNLATLSAQGSPQAHTLAYVSDGCAVYFTTRKDTRKAINMAANPKVAYVVDEDYADFMAIKGVQMEAVARVMSDAGEIERIAALYGQKFGGAPFPASEQHLCLKLEPVSAYFLDYSKGFGHKDLVGF